MILDIKTLSLRTAIPVRLIRYIIDNELVPERTWFIDSNAVGRARVFDEITAVFIACAAFLLNAGYKRDSITKMLSSISRIMPAVRKPMNVPVVAYVVEGQGKGRVQYADGHFVRWYTDGVTDEWIDPDRPKSPQSHFVPKVIVELDIAEIRDLVLGRSKPT